MAAQYLQMYCEPTSTVTSRHLRSAHCGRLTVPRTRTNYGDRSIAVEGPRVCNSLPAEQGRRHGFESGEDNFASGASKKFFFDPLTFWPVGGGQNIA